MLSNNEIKNNWEELVFWLQNREMRDSSAMNNPYAKVLPDIFSGLGLKPGQTALDAPCGKGGVSFFLAQKYRLKIMAYDISDIYLEEARYLSKQKGLEDSCSFGKADIRDLVQRKNICDLMLWISPPRIWKRADLCLKALRNCVKDQGLLIIGDSYLINPKKRHNSLQSLPAINKAYGSFGDSIIEFYDYGIALWSDFYSRAKKEIARLEAEYENKKELEIIKEYKEIVLKNEKEDKEFEALGAWIIKINK